MFSTQIGVQRPAKSRPPNDRRWEGTRHCRGQPLGRAAARLGQSREWLMIQIFILAATAQPVERVAVV